MSSSTLRPGEVIGGVWEVADKLGQGTFSEVYTGVHVKQGTKCALKVDKPGPRVGALQWESALLERLQKYTLVPRHYGFLTAPDGKTKVMAMQLMGNNVSSLRKRQPGGLLPFGAAVHIGLQMLACIEAVHQEGYIHRDIKPSNFVFGAPSSRAARTQLFILDFGQSRMYLDDRGGVRPARETAEFRGTSLYSSLHTHQLMDLGRRDDLWSLLYVLVDMIRGALPWRPYKEDRRRCAIIKEHYMAHPEELFHGLPGAQHLLQLHQHLAGLSFGDKPDYYKLATLMQAAIQDATAAGRLADTEFGWYPQSAELTAALAAEAGKAEDGELEKTVADLHNVSPPDLAAAVAHMLGAAAPTAPTDVRTLTALATAFDVTHLPMTCDSALESRGGRWGAWIADKEGSPAYTALLVDGGGQPTQEAAAVLASLQGEYDACEAILEDAVLAGIIDAGEGEDGDGVAGGTGTHTGHTQANGHEPHQHHSGHHRHDLAEPRISTAAQPADRRAVSVPLPGVREPEYEDKGPAFITRDLAARIERLPTLLVLAARHALAEQQDGSHDTAAAGLAAARYYAQHWRALAAAGGTTLFVDAAAAEALRQPAVDLLHSLLTAASGEGLDKVAQNGNSRSPTGALLAAAVQQSIRLLRQSKRFLALDLGSAADARAIALSVARVEQWHMICSAKAPQLLAVASFSGSAGDEDGGDAEEEAAVEKGLALEARKRREQLAPLLQALDRDRQLTEPVPSAAGWQPRSTAAAAQPVGPSLSLAADPAPLAGRKRSRWGVAPEAAAVASGMEGAVSLSGIPLPPAPPPPAAPLPPGAPPPLPPLPPPPAAPAAEAPAADMELE